MQSVVQSLIAGRQGLRADLELADVLLGALERRYASEPRRLREYVRRARRLSYASTVIGCYGLLEQTVDLMLVALAETYNQVLPSHEDIPDSVRHQHRDLLLTCLRDGDRARTRRPIDEQDILTALGRSGQDEPGLIPEAFTLSTANYRLPYVVNLLGRLGLDAQAGLYHGRVDDALTQTGFANYESFLDELVQRRNDLAHSYGDEDIVDRDLLASYIEIVSSYLLDLVRLANLFAIKTLRDWELEPIGTVVKVWTGRVGIRLEVDSIAIGDRLLLFKNDWCTSHEVEDLQSEDVTSIRFSVEGEPLNVGARISNAPPGSEGCEAFVIPHRFAEFWPGDDKWSLMPST